MNANRIPDQPPKHVLPPFQPHGRGKWITFTLALALAVLGITVPAPLRAVDAPQTFLLKTPRPVAYSLEPASPDASGTDPAATQWIRVRQVQGGRAILMGTQMLVCLRDPSGLDAILNGRPLRVLEQRPDGRILLEAPSPLSALRESVELSRLESVTLAHPVRRHTVRLQYAYSAQPNDPYYDQLIHLDARPPSPSIVEPVADLNVRSAWPFSTGLNTLIGFCDDGVESTHPDLAGRIRTDLGFNFFTKSDSGDHMSIFEYHGTATCGMAVALRNNRRGGSGVAPDAQAASLVIFDNSGNLVDEVTLGKAFARHTNLLDIQNHSWANADFQPLDISDVESAGVSNAISAGRHGLGIVIVRAGGNARTRDFSRRLGVGDGNLDGFGKDPRVITVAAVRPDGRAASYSTPGASLLVAAPGGDPEAGFQRLFTTDRAGANGRNRFDDADRNDYCIGATGVYGTSFATPQISGLAALLLSVNPLLSIRDVQHILALSARHIDLSDPDLATNGAGLVVSHNVGFGIPDAGEAVRMAPRWPGIGPLVTLTLSNAGPWAIPDDGLRVELSGPGVPQSLLSIPATGSLGVHPDQPTPALLLGDLDTSGQNTDGRTKPFAALMRRPGDRFDASVNQAQLAGAAFVVFYNNLGVSNRLTTAAPDYFRFVQGAEFSPTLAVMISREPGEMIQALLVTNNAVRARLRLVSTAIPITVTNQLRCEHVGVRLRWNHPSMADLRVTLRSPSGTLSILQRPGMNTAAVPDPFEFWSTHHLGESSAGIWTVTVTDEWPESTGRIDSVELLMRGAAIEDADADGLDDAWERRHFGGLAALATEDPDGDGASNLRESLMGTDPGRDDRPLQLDLSQDTPSRLRLTWPGSPGALHDVLGAIGIGQPFRLVQQLHGRHPETGIYVPVSATNQFYQIRTFPEQP